MDQLDRREWLLTNGLGSFASGTFCDARTRVYHGWLVAALDPPGQRTFLLSHIEASLELAGQVLDLGTNIWAGSTIHPSGYYLLQAVTTEPVPTWVWAQGQRWRLQRQIAMPYGVSSDPLRPPQHRVMIQYHYEGQQPAILRLRPLIGDRDYHAYQHPTADHNFSQVVGSRHVQIQSMRVNQPGTAWVLRWTQGQYQPDGTWYWNYYYQEDAERGYDSLEDLYSPGYLTVLLQPGDRVTLDALVTPPDQALPELTSATFEQIVVAEQQRLDLPNDDKTHSDQSHPELLQKLWSARDRFITYRPPTNEPCILAGYHWYGRRMRDTLLCIPGFCLTTGQWSLAQTLLAQIGRLCSQGLIPATPPDSHTYPTIPSLDCSLWWVETLGLYLEASQDWAFLAQQYEVVKQIYKAFTAGTQFNIRVDASDGLVTWDDGQTALTWMDASVDGRPVTPRHGKPIEVNALWYSALCWASQWAARLSATEMNSSSLQNQARRYAKQAEQVQTSLQKFWNPKLGYLFDRIEPDDHLNPTVRPNAVLALSLKHYAFSEEQARQILAVACDQLLTPYGLRSLAPGSLAYMGHYVGNSYQRELATHQGSVWSWLLGPFLRAWQRFYGEATPPNFDWNALKNHLEQEACVGQISELFDGDYPHQARGAVAKAVPIADLIRLLS